jgi:lysozyme
MSTEALELAEALCKQFEGFRSKPYLCPAGFPTIGYGTVYKPDGSKVTLTDPPISEEQAASWLRSELINNYMLGVLRASPILAQYPRALAAIADFAYNLGVPRYKSSTLRKRVDALDWNGANTEIRKWVMGGGKSLPGLVKRREAEALLLP